MPSTIRNPIRLLDAPVLRLASALVALASATTAAAQTCHIEWATMRDGVKLATEVYLPDGAAGPFPVILQRTPYNRSGAAPAAASNCNNAQMRYFAANGFVALNQDVRGRYRSEGVMNAMVQEANDGYDAIEWAAAQTWSNGNVGTSGGSYVGLTQWQPAMHQPPHLKAMAPQITASDYHDHWTYVNGVFDLWFAQSWMLLTFAGEQLVRNLEAAGTPAADIPPISQAWVAQGRASILSDWVWQLPLTAFDEYTRTDPPYQSLAPYYADWLAHPNYDPFWANLDIETRWDEVKVPSLNIGGWYDIFQIGTVRNFQGIQAEGATADARNGSMLVMRAQCHACPANTTAGEIDFGANNQYDVNALLVRFFARWLKNVDNGIDREPSVRLFVMVPPDTGTAASGFWVQSDRYPLEGTRTETFLLGSGGSANGASGDGVLFQGKPRGGRAAQFPYDRFVYDPANPVPTKGGNMCCINDLLASGAFDQRAIESRPDVLVYTSEPLAEDLTVIGQVNVKLFAATDAPDTDFTAKLVDVHPDGYAHNVLDRIVRSRFRHGSKFVPSPIHPHQPYEYGIELGNTATVFKAGHRIRLEVSSSNFPHYARNLNTGANPSTDARMQPALQKILHEPAHPSALELPVVPSIRRP